MTTLALPNYSALGSIVTENDDAFSAEKALRIADWDYLGGGATACAYRSPERGRAIKLVRGDDGNRATIEAALAYPDNPHLPTVYGFLDLGNGHFAVELELLESQSGQYRQWEGTWSPGRDENVRGSLPDFIVKQPFALAA